MRNIVELAPNGDVIAVRCFNCDDVVPHDEVTERTVRGRKVYYCSTCPVRFKLTCKPIKLDPADACGGPDEISAEEIAFGIESHGFAHGWNVRRHGRVIVARLTATRWAWLTDPGAPCGQCEMDGVE